MLLYDIFDAKIIHYQEKLDGSPPMTPDTRCRGCFILPRLLESHMEQVVGDSSGLR